MRFEVPPAIAEHLADWSGEVVAPRDAATVLLLRDRPGGLEVFLLHRRAALAAFGGMTVFPGGRVDPLDAGEVPWSGPDPASWPLGASPELSRALVCAAVREMFEEAGVLLAGPSPGQVVDDVSGPDWAAERIALEAHETHLAALLDRRGLVLRADLLRPWANWVTPKEERTRRYDTYFFVGALPKGQRADGENTETDQADWVTPQSGLDDFAAGRSFLLPPTWTQLDSLNGRTVAEVLAVERRIEPVEPHLAADEKTGNWEIEFFNSDRYNEARNSRGPDGYGPL
jgi:8-oxo-dGTP pyrophosphatase MutT (NUDIX family)